MLSFMVLAAPRSGTTWCANWLTTDATLCLHDPLWTHQYTELDAIESPKMLGISCTGTALFPDWVNSHPARKIILRRDLKEVDDSLERIGLTPCSKQWDGVLERIMGVHVEWTDIFDRPKEIYEYLLDREFDPERHAQLVEMNVQPEFSRLTINRDVTARLLREVSQAGAN